MLVICKHCLNPCKKFGKVDCEDYKTDNPDDWEKELKSLLDGSNPERFKELQNKIDYFNWGV